MLSNAQIEAVTKSEASIVTKYLISVENGLSSRNVFCAVEDQDGFMWFGTSDGLCRYDGNSFKTYTKQNFGLLGNEIAALAIDEKKHLIISFRNISPKSKTHKFIQVLDLNNSVLQTIEVTYPNLPFKAKDITSITSDENRKLIFVTNSPNQVWSYTFPKGFKLLGNLTLWDANENSDAVNNSNNYVTTIAQNGSIILKKFNCPSYFLQKNNLIPFSNILDESIIAITKNKSFLVHHTISNTLTKQSFPTTANHGAMQNSATFLHLAPVVKYSWIFPQSHSDDANFVYNLKKGIYLIDDTSFFLIAKPEEIANYIDFNICFTYKDSRGDRWLCTNSGVIQISVKPNYFRSCFSRKQVTKPSYNQVRGIYAADLFDVNAHKLTTTLYANVWQYLCISKKTPHEEKISYANNNSAFNALLKHKNKFYIGGVDKIFEYDPAQNKSIEFGAIGENLGFNYMWSLTAVSDNILLAGYVGGLSQFNILTKKSNPLPYASSSIPKAKNVYRFVKTKAKGLVAVAENGLFVIDKNNTVVDYYGSSTKDASHHLPITTIFDMHEDAHGICWIASSGEGLFRWDWRHSKTDKKSSVKQFTAENGLPSMVLYRIEEDSEKNLWIGSSNGLMRFNTVTYTTSVFTTNDGLNNNEFNRTSSFKAADGTLYFGGLDGVNAFNPQQLMAFESKYEPILALTSLTKFSGKEKKLIDVLVALKQDKKTVLQSDDTLLILAFQLLDFQQRKHLYAYKIDGIDADWNYIEENTIRLSGLPYGEFKIHIKAQLANGQWNNHPIVFPIIILKPFYQHLWFIITVFVLIAIGMFGFFRYRTRKIIKEKQQLELKVAHRTTDLKKALTDRERLLAEIHHRVKNNLHVINGLLQLQKDELLDPVTKAAFSEGQSRIESIALIHQNLYQNEALGNIEFCSFMHDLSSKVAMLYNNPANQVAFTIQREELFLDVDTAVPLGLIVNELLTNSYKHFDAKKKRKTIFIGVTRLAEGQYELIYKDNGSGLPDHIDFETNKTLGLKLIKGLAKQLLGKATYSYDQGSVFTVFFQDAAIRYNS
jgi:two-component sensor histidine kinase